MLRFCWRGAPLWIPYLAARRFWSWDGESLDECTTLKLVSLRKTAAEFCFHTTTQKICAMIVAEITSQVIVAAGGKRM